MLSMTAGTSINYPLPAISSRFFLVLISLIGLVATLTAQVGEVYEISKLPAIINTDTYDEASPVLSADGSYLYFTRTGSPDFDKTLMQGGSDISKKLSQDQYTGVLKDIYSHLAQDDIPDPAASGFNQDVWRAVMINGSFKSVFHPGPPLNNALPNSVVSLGPGDSSLVVINQFYRDGSMYEGFSLVNLNPDGTHTFPEPIHIYEFYNSSDDVNLSMTADGLVMILSLEREDSFGKNDLYVSFKVGQDIWSEPQLIGSPLSTSYQEATPFISRDRRHLYFSSDRPGSLGGSDIWVTKRLDYSWLKWSEPVRLKEPINSPFDDAYACINEDETHLYFASKRDGSSDIFDASLIPPIVLPRPLDIVCTVVDGITGKPVRAEILWGPQVLEGYLEYFETYTGKMNTQFHEPEVYKFLVQKRGYEPSTLLFDAVLAAKQDLPVYNVVLRVFPKKVETVIEEASENVVAEEIGKLEVGQTLSFYNIYFEKTKATVLPQSHAALNQLVDGLREHEDVKIRIEGHTDNVGNEKDLMELSWQRAESIKGYLVDSGIAANRISTLGYGAERPISDNLTEEGKSKNRRVEVRIIERL